jgi:hypothetical protein
MRSDPIRDLRAYAADLEGEVPVGHARARVAAIVIDTAPVRPRRAVVAVATAALMGLSNAALAAVADPAVPGDTLYGVDRAYERIAEALGLDTERATERLDEAEVLVGRGRAAEALALVREALDEVADAGSLDEARALLAELQEHSGLADETVKPQIAELLEKARAVAEIARSGEMGEIARELGGPGRDISEIARQLRESMDNPSETRPTGPDRSSTTNPAETRPTPPSNPGQGNTTP